MATWGRSGEISAESSPRIYGQWVFTFRLVVISIPYADLDDPPTGFRGSFGRVVEVSAERTSADTGIRR